AAPQRSHLRHLRRLRQPDRLGDRHLSGVRQGGREGRLHHLARRAHPALPGSPAGDQGRVLRALRRGAAPHRHAGRQAARLAAGVLACQLPAGVDSALDAVQGDQHAARPLREEVQGRADLQRRRQAPGPHAAPLQGRLRPRRHRPAGALVQARSGALQGVRAPHRHAQGLGARDVEPLLRRGAVPEAQGAGHLDQPPQGDPGGRRQEADRRGQDPARGRQAPGRGV
ncbi:MAG: 2-haloalkanoic acid dehalogenase, partial [uncultured Solirubrobacteraceae bacterium]